ncbi:MAG: hypothetical protein FWD43_02590 [Coriobacteriia bacterium]|nr:hypothetical protein [Coriobacteriia bacterium]
MKTKKQQMNTRTTTLSSAKTIARFFSFVLAIILVAALLPILPRVALGEDLEHGNGDEITNDLGTESDGEDDGTSGESASAPSGLDLSINPTKKEYWSGAISLFASGWTVPADVQDLTWGGVSANSKTSLSRACMQINEGGKSVTLYFFVSSSQKALTGMSYAGVAGIEVGSFNNNNDDNNVYKYAVYAVTVPANRLNNGALAVSSGSGGHSITGTFNITNLVYEVRHYIYNDNTTADPAETGAAWAVIPGAGFSGMSTSATPIRILGYEYDDTCPWEIAAGTVPTSGNLVLKLYYKNKTGALEWSIDGTSSESTYNGDTQYLGSATSAALYTISLPDPGDGGMYSFKPAAGSQTGLTNANPAGYGTGIYMQNLRPVAGYQIWYTGPNTSTGVVGGSENVTHLFDEPTISNGALTITPRHITITAASEKRPYDGTMLMNDGCEVTEGALAGNDYIESAQISGMLLTPGSCINGISDAVIKNAGGVDVTPNYVISYKDGALEVTPAVLTIVVKDMTLVQGSPIPMVFSLTVTGFADGEGPSILGGVAQYQTSYTASARAGESHLIELSGIIADNYTIEYEFGTITVVSTLADLVPPVGTGTDDEGDDGDDGTGTDGDEGDEGEDGTGSDGDEGDEGDDGTGTTSDGDESGDGTGTTDGSDENDGTEPGDENDGTEQGDGANAGMSSNGNDSSTASAGNSTPVAPSISGNPVVSGGNNTPPAVTEFDPNAAPLQAFTEINGEVIPLVSTIAPIVEEVVPLGNTSSWALLNLILMAAGILVAIAMIVAFLFRGNKDEDEDSNNHAHAVKEYRNGMLWCVACLVAGIIAVVLFLTTEDITVPMVLADLWTVPQAILFVLQLAIVVLAVLHKRDTESNVRINEYIEIAA